MRIVADVDGVSRDLAGYLEKELDFKIRNWNWNHHGKSIFEIIKEMNYEPLLKATPTEYIDLVDEYAVELWTSQPKSWVSYTMDWLSKYLPTKKVRLFPSIIAKEESLDHVTILIEDFPGFDSFRNIILVDRAYNKDVQCKRVKNPYELERIIKEVLK